MADGSSNWVTGALDRYEGRLVRYTARLVGDVDVARDIVQNGFLKLCQQRREDVEGQLQPWLFTVCRNQAVDHLRRERMRARNEPRPDDDADGSSPVAPLLRKERVGFLLACVDELPPRQQEVLRLKFAEGMSYKEIAGVLDTTVNAVGVAIHTAIRRLRDRVDADVATVAREGRGR